MTKVIIAGSRTFNNYSLLKEVCDEFLQGFEDIEIVCGTAIGADQYGKEYALENNYLIKEFVPNWKKFGKKSGILRNREMAQYGHILIAFWDGVSKGTSNMIQEARKRKLLVKIVNY